MKNESQRTGVISKTPRGKLDKAYQIHELTRKIDNLHIRGMFIEEKRITKRLETRLINTLEKTPYQNKKDQLDQEYQQKKQDARSEFGFNQVEMDKALSDYLEKWNVLIEKYGIIRYEVGDDLVLDD